MVAGPGRAAEEPPPDALERVSARVRELAATYRPPDFAEVPTPDAAFFLTAIDHSSGYAARHLVEGEGPYEGSALLWARALAFERRRPGLLSAESLRDVSGAEVATLLTVEGDGVSDPGERARLWRDAAAVLIDDYAGSAAELIASAEGSLGGPGGVLARLAAIEAYSDPLAKKSFLVSKIWERRGWLAVADPGVWKVCADNVLMRLALRAGLVAQGEVERVRAATREAFGAVAESTGVSPPVLDDLLWELGREDPDLLGAAAGDLSEPPRRE
ncbi:MAG: hypothetical protein M3M99_00775, partial [Actinomycetota bacterium]|nr:hypothetical protein [Actinomycetota bacterium]